MESHLTKVIGKDTINIQKINSYSLTVEHHPFKVIARGQHPLGMPNKNIVIVEKQHYKKIMEGELVW